MSKGCAVLPLSSSITDVTRQPSFRSKLPLQISSQHSPKREKRCRASDKVIWSKRSTLDEKRVLNLISSDNRRTEDDRETRFEGCRRQKIAFVPETRGKERGKAASKGSEEKPRGHANRWFWLVAFIFIPFHQSPLFSSDHICISYVMDPSTRLHMGCTFSGKVHVVHLERETHRVSSNLVSIVKKKSGQIFLMKLTREMPGSCRSCHFYKTVGQTWKMKLT